MLFPPISKVLSQSLKDKRKDCVAKLLNKYKLPQQLNILYFDSDKKIFFKNQMVNAQNHRWVGWLVGWVLLHNLLGYLTPNSFLYK